MLPRIILSVLILSLSCARAESCTIPVFRYALERWRPDVYELILFHRGPLPAELQTIVNDAKGSGESPKAIGNFKSRTVDVSGKLDPAIEKLWQAQGSPSLPWLVVRYPKNLGIEASVWAGPPRRDTVRSLIDSPARREIERRLLQGESAVWVLLSGNAPADKETANLLHAEIRKLEKQLKLPDAEEKPDARPQGVSPKGETQLLSDLPVRIAFSVVRVARDDPAEKILVDMVVHANKELAETKETIAFPVFGRGRALDAFVGKEINAATIEAVSRFMCGACSCEVKGLHPGVDLLMAGDWDSVLKDGAPAETPSPKTTHAAVSLPRLPPPSAKKSVSGPTPPSIKQSTSEGWLSRQSDTFRIIWCAAIAVAGTLVVVTGVRTLRSLMKPRTAGPNEVASLTNTESNPSTGVVP